MPNGLLDKNPLDEFKEKLCDFATGERRGIRNPFVVAPVAPSQERRVAAHLTHETAWGATGGVQVHPVFLDRLMPKTLAFEVTAAVSSNAYEQEATNGSQPMRRGIDQGARAGQHAERTLRDNLAQEIVSLLVEDRGDDLRRENHVLLLLHLGSLYPFARASELFDELDRQRVRATVGMLFPGRIYGGKLSFFGEEARHYYPAHRIPEQIGAMHLPE